MRADPWTEERVELLKTLWREGKTAAAIATRFGDMSRSAILGKIFRLRLPPAEQAAVQQPAAENPQAMPATGDDRSLARRRHRAVREKPLPQSQPNAQPKSTTKTLLELTNDCCRWPFRRPGTSRYFFCGADGADLERGVPYCARHMKRAYINRPYGADMPPSEMKAAMTPPVKPNRRPVVVSEAPRSARA